MNRHANLMPSSEGKPPATDSALKPRYKVCVYAISKNEEQFVDRWASSAREADMAIVTDTGSRDATVEKLRAAGVIVYQETIDPWRFDVARNIAMDYIPEDVDICVSVDLDEVFEPGWRKKLETAWDTSYTRARYAYIWSHTADGLPDVQFTMEKVHRRHGFRWVHPVHEVLRYSGPDEDKTVWANGLVLHHYPDLKKPRSGYLPLLELSALEKPQDDRAAFWLGREYLYHGKYGPCIETLKKHLTLPSARWAEERSASMRFIGAAYEAIGNMEEAKSWLFRAIAECPGIREPYLKMAKLGYSESNWPLTYAMATKGLEITKRSDSYLTEPESWGYALYILKAISSYCLGLHEESREYLDAALSASGSNEGLKIKLRLAASMLANGQEGAQDEKI